MATKRRRFTAEFKARVAMEALRGDRTIQAIAAKHEVGAVTGAVACGCGPVGSGKVAVLLHQHRVVHGTTERRVNGFQLGTVTVGGDLQAMIHPAGQIVHQIKRCGGTAVAHAP